MHPDEQYFKIVFCRVCGFRIWVWKSYRTCRSSGYGYGCFTELTEVPGGYAKIAPVSVPDGTRTPGCCCSHNNSSPPCRPWSQGRLQCLKRKNTSGGKKTKNIKTIIGTNRIAQTKITKVRSSYVTRVSCHGPTELEQVLGTGMNVVHNSHKNLHKFRVRVWMSCRSHRFPGYVLQNSQKFRVGIRTLYPYPGYFGTGVQLRKVRVRVWISCTTRQRSSPGYGCCTELTYVPGTGNTCINTRLKGAKNNTRTNETKTCNAFRILRFVYCIHWYNYTINTSKY